MTNYRGITISALFGKIIEKLIQTSMDRVLLPKQSYLQFGFTKGLAPIMASLCLTEAIAHSKERKNHLLVGTLDVQKAFDVVDHKKMKIKLHMDGLRGRNWELVESLSNNLSETVNWRGSISKSPYISKGVRQGAILSTSLYKLYINDLLGALEAANVGMSIGSIYIGTPTCADDQLLIANSVQDMQAMLNTVQDHSKNIYIASIQSKARSPRWPHLQTPSYLN